MTQCWPQLLELVAPVAVSHETLPEDQIGLPEDGNRPHTFVERIYLENEVRECQPGLFTDLFGRDAAEKSETFDDPRSVQP